MSDFEDYAYSPYDDIEDILYDADPAPELADDLAEHAVHSPIYEGEIAGSELQDYFSDWEYYSDDYMDDDPVLLKQNPQAGSPLSRSSRKENDKNGKPKRGKKRKLNETPGKSLADAQDVDLISRCIKGTVWAKPATVGPPCYKEGQQLKVALMKNWREVFAITDSGWGRSQRDINEDESWAKDMSLEDMGLKNVQGQPFEQNGEHQESVYDDNGQDEEEIAGGEIEEDASNESPSTALPVGSDGVSDDELPRKRRRLKPDHPSLSTLSPSTLFDTKNIDASSTDRASLSSRESADKPPDHATANDSHSKPEKPSAVKELSSNDSRKRKALEEVYVEEAGPLKSTASSRAKRVASTNSKSASTAPTSSRRTRNGGN
ncbi:hypothetical protein A1O3_07434 [Capronia epimyces CBS 606.96]|uniref:Uncharacterized protein n=1 Tax=Capronia epimyces CBS 606.96 TaxID=1182542 RepID=W9XUW6_9EURO|nr:uncharacterized protein A1O3_07434 [Capronia epimyces CBS 606.96]EXJ81145.1 hypothetical protein A1O3_07434 [Capronia epimyces CBS 606.96]